MQISPHVACVVPQLWLTLNVSELQVLLWCKSAQRKNCRNWSFQGMVWFYLHNLHKCSSRPSSSLTAGCRRQGCGAVLRQKSPSPAGWPWPQPHSSSAGEELCWLPWDRVTENSPWEPPQFAICSLTALLTSFVVHSSVQFKLWSFMALVRTSGHFSTKSRLLSVQSRTQLLLCKLEACSSLCYSN